MYHFNGKTYKERAPWYPHPTIETTYDSTYHTIKNAMRYKRAGEMLEAVFGNKEFSIEEYNGVRLDGDLSLDTLVENEIVTRRFLYSRQATQTAIRYAVMLNGFVVSSHEYPEYAEAVCKSLNERNGTNEFTVEQRAVTLYAGGHKPIDVYAYQFNPKGLGAILDAERELNVKRLAKVEEKYNRLSQICYDL